MKTKVEIEVAGNTFTAHVYDKENLSNVTVERHEENMDHHFINMNLSPVNCKEISSFFLALSSVVKIAEEEANNEVKI